jgi:hypothetical protein
VGLLSPDDGRPRRGRYRRHLPVARSNRIHLRFDANEHDDIAAAARRSGLTPTGFCADAALAAARRLAGPAELVAGPGLTRFELAVFQRELFIVRAAAMTVAERVADAVRAVEASDQAPPWLVQVVSDCQLTIGRLDSVVLEIDGRLR